MKTIRFTLLVAILFSMACNCNGQKDNNNKIPAGYSAYTNERFDF